MREFVAKVASTEVGSKVAFAQAPPTMASDRRPRYPLIVPRINLNNYGSAAQRWLGHRAMPVQNGNTVR